MESDAYDAIYELLNVTQGGSTTESYSYDAVGNRLSSSGVPSYSYNTSNELVSTSSGSYTYDADGNTLTDASGKSYTWDFENRMASAVVPGTGTVTFKYDPFGRRIYKSSPNFTGIFAYDGYNLIETMNSSGTVVSRYTQTQNIDEPLAEDRSGGNSYYEADALGSITSLTSSTGSVESTHTYDSFGNITNFTGTLQNPFQFAGREYDKETSQYFNRARYYNPTVGRFIGEDPIRFSGGLDFYRYVLNSPTNYPDPFGLCPLGNRNLKKICSVLPDATQIGIGGDLAFFWGLGGQLTATANGNSGEFTISITGGVDHGVIGPDWYGSFGVIRNLPSNSALQGFNWIFSGAGARTGIQLDPAAKNGAVTFGPSLFPFTFAGQFSKTKNLFTIPNLGYVLYEMRALCRALTGD